MYQRRSNLQNLMILLLDCLTIVVSLILANYIRNGRLFESDDARMDFGLLLGAVLVVFLAMNLFGSLYRNMMLRGPLHECMCVIRNKQSVLRARRLYCILWDCWMLTRVWCSSIFF